MYISFLLGFTYEIVLAKGFGVKLHDFLGYVNVSCPIWIISTMILNEVSSLSFL